MTIIKCPKCNTALQINISSAVDEHGEVFKCPNCGYFLRYANN